MNNNRTSRVGLSIEQLQFFSFPTAVVVSDIFKWRSVFIIEYWLMMIHMKKLMDSISFIHCYCHCESENTSSIIVMNDLQIMLFTFHWFFRLRRIHHWFPKQKKNFIINATVLEFFLLLHLNGKLDIYLIECMEMDGPIRCSALLKLFIKNTILFLFKTKWLGNLMEQNENKMMKKKEWNSISWLAKSLFDISWMGIFAMAQSNNILAFLKLLRIPCFFFFFACSEQRKSW